MNRIGWSLLLLIGLSAAAWAEPQIRVLALFTDKAMLEIDGKKRLLVKGKKSPEGVILVSANGKEAVVRYGDKEFTLTPKARIGTRYVVPQRPEIRIVRDNTGHYRTSGTINGQSVSFLVDTGATGVAINEGEARKLGVPFELKGNPMMIQTASGLAKSYSVTFDSVSVGGIKQRNVAGVVVEGGSPRQALLGMSFLGSLEMHNQGNMMVLKKR